MPVCNDGCALGTLCIHSGPGRDAWEAGYDAGFGAGAAEALTFYPPPERAILADLIVELQAGGHRPVPCCGGKHQVCEGCDETWPCYPAYYAEIADNAAARLLEVTGDE